MPSSKKILHFLSSALVTSIAVVCLGFAMTTKWAQMTMECASAGMDFVNGSAMVTLELFTGNVDRTDCPQFGKSDEFEVIPTLAKKEVHEVTSLVLHALVVCLLSLCLVFSAVSILISVYNSVSNPYETYVGPQAIYFCNSFNVCMSVVALVIFVLNVHFTNMAEALVRVFTELVPVDLRDKTSQMLLGYYLLIPYAVFSLVGVGLIYMYENAAYTHRQEQQRPTEDAPKDIMMY